MQEFDDVDLEPLSAEGLTLPLLRLNDIDLPATLITVGGDNYQYDRSYPIKGYGAVMPPYVAAQIAAGRKPLVVERLSRFYLYFAAPATAAPS